MKSFTGYLKQALDGSYMLLANGDHKSLSSLFTDFSRDNNDLSITIGGTTKKITLGTRAFDDTEYFPLSGGTISGSILVSGNNINLGSNTSFFSNASVNRVYLHHLDSTGVESGKIYVNYYGLGDVVFSNGRVGIGTNSPTYKLHVVGGYAAFDRVCIKRLNDNDPQYMFIGTKGTSGADKYTLRISNQSGSPVNLDLLEGIVSITNNTSYGTLKCGDISLGGDGNWHQIKTVRTGIGESSIGGVDGCGLYFYHKFSGGAEQYMYLKGGTGLGIGTVPSYKLHVNGNCAAANFYTTSDARKKQNIHKISDNIKLFEWKDSGETSYGFVAQDLEIKHPELVNDDGSTKTVNYNAALSLVIAKLENRVKELEAKLGLETPPLYLNKAKLVSFSISKMEERRVA